jgi:hypothetical protein
MQTQVATPLRTVAHTFARRVSGGEVAIRVRETGAAVYWMNGHRVDRATVARKIAR